MKFKIKLKIRQYPLLYETIALLVVALTIFIVNVHAVVKNKPQAQNIVQPEQNTSVEVPAIEGNYNLVISKIDIKVPIVTDIDGKKKTTYIKSLNNGVAHMKDTALPGQEGNTFIFGHSSYYSGDYKKIFATLNKLEKDDDITITSNKKEYKYKVTNKKVVAADAMEVTKQPKGKKILTLMTCWPIGTNEKRLVVIADLQE